MRKFVLGTAVASFFVMVSTSYANPERSAETGQIGVYFRSSVKPYYSSDDKGLNYADVSTRFSNSSESVRTLMQDLVHSPIITNHLFELNLTFSPAAALVESFVMDGAYDELDSEIAAELSKAENKIEQQVLQEVTRAETDLTNRVSSEVAAERTRQTDRIRRLRDDGVNNAMTTIETTVRSQANQDPQVLAIRASYAQNGQLLAAQDMILQNPLILAPHLSLIPDRTILQNPARYPELFQNQALVAAVLRDLTFNPRYNQQFTSLSQIHQAEVTTLGEAGIAQMVNARVNLEQAARRGEIEALADAALTAGLNQLEAQLQLEQAQALNDGKSTIAAEAEKEKAKALAEAKAESERIRAAYAQSLKARFKKFEQNHMLHTLAVAGAHRVTQDETFIYYQLGKAPVSAGADTDSFGQSAIEQVRPVTDLTSRLTGNMESTYGGHLGVTHVFENGIQVATEAHVIDGLDAFISANQYASNVLAYTDAEYVDRMEEQFDLNTQIFRFMVKNKFVSLYGTYGQAQLVRKNAKGTEQWYGAGLLVNFTKKLSAVIHYYDGERKQASNSKSMYLNYAVLPGWNVYAGQIRTKDMWDAEVSYSRSFNRQEDVAGMKARLFKGRALGMGFVFEASVEAYRGRTDSTKTSLNKQDSGFRAAVTMNVDLNVTKKKPSGASAQEGRARSTFIKTAQAQLEAVNFELRQERNAARINQLNKEKARLERALRDRAS